MRLRWEGVVHTMMRWTIVILVSSSLWRHVPLFELAVIGYDTITVPYSNFPWITNFLLYLLQNGLQH